MKRFLILVFAFTLFLGGVASAQGEFLKIVLPSGESVQIVCDGSNVEFLVQKEITGGVVSCLAVLPTPTPVVVLPTVTPTTALPTPTKTPVPPTPTKTPTPSTATPAPTIVPPTPGVSQGIWISQAEIDKLPMSGSGWESVLNAADSNAGSPSLYNQDSNNNVMIMAKALVYARTKEQKYYDEVASALRAIATGNLESGTDGLPLGRELAAYVIAADVVNLKVMDPALDAQFRTKIKSLLTYPLSKGPDTLIACDEERPNNWGGHCGASRIAVDLYLGDYVDLDKAATVLKGFLGDREAYANFKYGGLWWQADPSRPVGINPVGATIEGYDVSGSQPEEMRRVGSSFTWPPSFTDYGWEGLQGRVAAAHMLARAGYDVWSWSDKAILRAVEFLYGVGWPATGDDEWQVWVINNAYGTDYPTTGGRHGKNVGWTMWTLQ